MEGVLAAAHGTLVLLGLTVDGLDVHQQVVADAETTPTFLALQKWIKRREAQSIREGQVLWLSSKQWPKK